MPYLVLARKYRPKNFTEMVGQTHVVQALVNALDSQRLHHAYLFTGTRGVGKTTVSRILAKSLNCQGPDGQGTITSRPCGICQACNDIDSGRFVDYTELDAASNRGVDEVQSLLEQAVYKPVQGRFKVFMIDEVHMLTNTAFNAMLKTLEEPPPYLKFVLATTDPQKVPVTVLSRCLQFNLRPMAPETIREHLQQVLQAEQVAADAASMALLARAARGSMRDALSLTDQAIAYCCGSLVEAEVRRMLGSVDRTHALALIEALAAGDGRSVVERAELLRLNGLSAAATLEDMLSALQRMAVMQWVPLEAEACSNDAEHVRLQRLAQLMPADETQLLYSLCLHGLAELGLAPDEYAALTMILLRLLAFKPPQGGRPLAEKKTLKRPQPEPLAGSLAPETGLAAEAAQRQHAACAPEPAASDLRPLVVRDMDRIDDPVISAERQGAVAAPPQVRRPPELTSVPVLSPPQVDPPLAAAAQASEAKPVAPSAEGDFWDGLVRDLVQRDAITAMARELAWNSQLLARDTDHWLLRVERESLNQGGSRDRLALALAAAGHPVQLSIELGRAHDTPGQRRAAAAAKAQQLAENIVRNDPFVQTMMREFGAQIVPGSVKLVGPDPG